MHSVQIISIMTLKECFKLAEKRQEFSNSNMFHVN